MSALEIGLRRPLLHRRETVRVGLERPQRLVYASDLHLRARVGFRLAAEVLEAAGKCGTKLVLLGGDLVDTPSGLPILRELIRLLRGRGITVAAVGGNHDWWVGTRRIERTARRAGAVWLETCELDFGPLQVLGRPARPSSGQVAVVCAHYPEAFTQSVRLGLPLTLAGHLHGGQLVFWEQDQRLMPAGWVYRWNGLRFQELGSTLLMSRGMTDMVPLRWNCPRELLVVDLI